MYKVEHVSYDPARIVSFAPRLEERMNERANEGWVLLGQPMVSEKLAFVILFWFRAEESEDDPAYAKGVSFESPGKPVSKK